MISVVIPVLNEAENIAYLVPEIYSSVKWEINEVILVDGHSTDRTNDVVAELMGRYPTLKFVKQDGKGFANALMYGIKNATGEFIVTMDAENHLPSEINRLMNTIKKRDASVVVGSRFLKQSNVDLAKTREMSTKMANKLAKAILGLGIKDCSSGFRAYKSDDLKKVIEGVKTEYFSIQVEILERIKERGGKILEVPIHYLERKDGRSKFKFKPAIKDGLNIVRIAAGERAKQIKKRIGKK